jgi:hypothetical protein
MPTGHSLVKVLFIYLFIYGLFNGDISTSGFIDSNGRKVSGQ